LQANVTGHVAGGLHVLGGGLKLARGASQPKVAPATKPVGGMSERVAEQIIPLDDDHEIASF
ncbi:MAG: hypothetical protein KAY24_16390, partial [Candidatus Eisenbacteria sp.]|nr:hypothetical protein [Candidatus Eisenbacteria bacterium]